MPDMDNDFIVAADNATVHFRNTHQGEEGFFWGALWAIQWAASFPTSVLADAAVAASKIERKQAEETGIEP